MLRDAEAAPQARAAAHHRVHRRDPPLQQGAAGRPAGARGVGRRGADRRHHREPLLRGERGAALALPHGGPEAARRATSSRIVLERALADDERGLGALSATVAPDALDFLAAAADGDARTALNVLELAVTTAEPDRRGRAAWWTCRPCARRSRARRCSTTARARSTSTSSARCTSRCATPTPTPALYWLARMLEAGEDPLYVARRLVRFASEDVGLADPYALVLAMAAQQAVHFVGLPEGSLALAQLVVYLAAAPKSNALYTAYGEAARDALATRAEPVPLWIRNAPTGAHEGPGLRARLPLRARRAGGRLRHGLPARGAGRPALLPAHRPRAGKGDRRTAAKPPAACGKPSRTTAAPELGRPRLQGLQSLVRPSPGTLRTKE